MTQRVYVLVEGFKFLVLGSVRRFSLGRNYSRLKDVLLRGLVLNISSVTIILNIRWLGAGDGFGLALGVVVFSLFVQPLVQGSALAFREITSGQAGV